MIRYLTNATPDVSDIPGTTLVPHLGHIPYRDGVKVSVADLPGIEPRDIPYYFNTSARAGRFLQHCARCSALIYLVDGDEQLPLSPAHQFLAIRRHLAEYDVTIERELREVELAKTEFPDRFDHLSRDGSAGTGNFESLTELPFLVAITKTDLEQDQSRRDALQHELDAFRQEQQNLLLYPKLISTSAVDMDGFSILTYLLRHMKESRSGRETNDLFW